jgi:hypothetical protein
MNRSKRKPKGARLILGEGMSPGEMGIMVERVVLHGPKPKRLMIGGKAVGTYCERISLNLPLKERRGV